MTTWPGLNLGKACWATVDMEMAPSEKEAPRPIGARNPGGWKENAPRLRTLDDQVTAPSSGSCTTVVRWSSLVMTSRNSLGVILKRDVMGAPCSSATSFIWHSASLADRKSTRLNSSH